MGRGLHGMRQALVRAVRGHGRPAAANTTQLREEGLRGAHAHICLLLLPRVQVTDVLWSLAGPILSNLGFSGCIGAAAGIALKVQARQRVHLTTHASARMPLQMPTCPCMCFFLRRLHHNCVRQPPLPACCCLHALIKVPRLPRCAAESWQPAGGLGGPGVHHGAGAALAGSQQPTRVCVRACVRMLRAYGPLRAVVEAPMSDAVVSVHDASDGSSWSQLPCMIILSWATQGCVRACVGAQGLAYTGVVSVNWGKVHGLVLAACDVNKDG